MLKELPLSLVQSTQKIVETHPVLETCVNCGAVCGSCLHSDAIDGLQEDNLTAQAIPKTDEPETELSGEQEQVVINPEYKTFNTRR